MKQTVMLVLALVMAVSGAVAATPPPPKSSPEIPAKVQSGHRPLAGVDYTLAPGSLYKPKPGDDPGPADAQTSIAWGLANEFVYRTALAGEAALPARSAGPTKDGWYEVVFAGTGGKPELKVLVQNQHRVVKVRRTLPQ